MLDRLDGVNRISGEVLGWLHSPFVLALRFYVGWQFFKAGLVKLGSWDSTLWLFENEYRTPLLSPWLAAILGTSGELIFPVFLALGLLTRPAAIGLFAVNAMAVVSYSHFLLADGSEAALGQHVLWGVILLAIVIYGPGRVSLDELLGRLRRPSRAASLPTTASATTQS